MTGDTAMPGTLLESGNGVFILVFDENTGLWNRLRQGWVQEVEARLKSLEDKLKGG